MNNLKCTNVPYPSTDCQKTTTALGIYFVRDPIYLDHASNTLLLPWPIYHQPMKFKCFSAHCLAVFPRPRKWPESKTEEKGFAIEITAFAGPIYKRQWVRPNSPALTQQSQLNTSCTFSKTLFQGSDCFLNKNLKDSWETSSQDATHKQKQSKHRRKQILY